MTVYANLTGSMSLCDTCLIFKDCSLYDFIWRSMGVAGTLPDCGGYIPDIDKLPGFSIRTLLELINTNKLNIKKFKGNKDILEQRIIEITLDDKI